MPVLMAVGAWADLQFQPASIRASRIGVRTLLALLGVLLLTGLTARTAGPHRFLAHFFIGVAWLVIFFAIGVGLAECVRSGRWSAAYPAMALVVALGAMLAAAGTGYMGRLSNQTGDVIRFRLIHQLLMPGALGACLVGCLRLSRTHWERAE